MSKKQLRIGLVGTGLMGRAHSNAYRTAPNFFDLPLEPVLQAVCARSDGAASAFAENWGFASAETDWRKIVERDDIDAMGNVQPATGSVERHPVSALDVVDDISLLTAPATPETALTCRMVRPHAESIFAPTKPEAKSLTRCAPLSC